MSDNLAEEVSAGDSGPERVVPTPTVRAPVAGYVYFIWVPVNGLTKIGFTDRHPDTRFAELQLRSPVPLLKWAAIYADSSLESSLHRQFANARTHGEWFRSTDALREYVEENGDKWPKPLPGTRQMRGRQVDYSLTKEVGDLRNEIKELKEETDREIAKIKAENERLRSCLAVLKFSTADIRRLTPERMAENLQYVVGQIKERCRRELEESLRTGGDPSVASAGSVQ